MNLMLFDAAMLAPALLVHASTHWAIRHPSMRCIGAGRDLNTWLWLCASKACMLGKGICLLLSRFCPYWTATLFCAFTLNVSGIDELVVLTEEEWLPLHWKPTETSSTVWLVMLLSDWMRDSHSKTSCHDGTSLLYSLFIEAGCKPAGEILEGRWDANPGHHLHSFHKAPRTTRVMLRDMWYVCVLNKTPEDFAECLTSFQHWDWELWKHPFYWDWRLSGSQDMLWPRVTEEWIKSSALYLGAPILASWPYWGRDMFSRDIGQMDANFRTYCDILWPKIVKNWDDLSCLDVFKYKLWSKSKDQK